MRTEQERTGRLLAAQANEMFGKTRHWRPCHWILEIHLVDTAREFGGFYEQLLDLG